MYFRSFVLVSHSTVTERVTFLNVSEVNTPVSRSYFVWTITFTVKCYRWVFSHWFCSGTISEGLWVNVITFKIFLKKTQKSGFNRIVTINGSP